MDFCEKNGIDFIFQLQRQARSRVAVAADDIRTRRALNQAGTARWRFPLTLPSRARRDNLTSETRSRNEGGCRHCAYSSIPPRCLVRFEFT
jgi:hypothetical protein